MKTANHASLLALMLVAMASATAHAEMDMYMYIDGIPGESVAEGHTNWIDCWWVGFKMRSPPQVRGRINHLDFRFGKHVDKATPLLGRRISDGATIPSVVVHLQRGSASTSRFYEIVFSNATFNMFWTEGNTTAATEFIMFDYEMFQWSYTEEGASQGPWIYADTVNDRSGYVTSNIDDDPIADIIDPDDDNDGFLDWEEALAGTDPTDPDNYLRVALFQQSDTNALLEWTSVTNRIYEIFAAGSPEGPYGSSGLGLITNPSPGGTSREVPLSPNMLFYRVVAREE